MKDAGGQPDLGHLQRALSYYLAKLPTSNRQNPHTSRKRFTGPVRTSRLTGETPQSGQRAKNGRIGGRQDLAIRSSVWTASSGGQDVESSMAFSVATRMKVCH